MIDKENEVYTRVREKVLEEFPKADVDTSYQSNPSVFPHVSFYQMDSYSPKEFLDSATYSKFSAVTFEAQVYSNSVESKHTDCKRIMAIINDVMEEMNFRRTTLTQVPNLNNASIYRLAARFEGVVDAHGFYRR